MAETSLPKRRTAEGPPRASGSAFLRLLRRSESARAYVMMAPTLLIMTLGIVVPFVILLVISLWTRAGFGFDTTLTLANYARSWNEPIYGTLLLRSFWISGVATAITVLLCYPMAYYVAFHVHRNKMMWIILMTLPFWTSYLLRVFAWKVILGYEGVINSGLMSAGLIEAPLSFLLYSPTAVIITLAHAWAAFAILPLYVSLEKIDRSLLEAATDLGDGPMARFFRVTLPLSMPGVIAGFMLVFVPAIGEFVIPELLGGPNTLMIGKVLWGEFFSNRDWPVASAVAVVMLIVVVAPFMLLRNAQARAEAE